MHISVKKNANPDSQSIKICRPCFQAHLNLREFNNRLNIPLDTDWSVSTNTQNCDISIGSEMQKAGSRHPYIGGCAGGPNTLIGD